ncbi:hypothetical protein JCM21900_006757 [Sporobolomyces salmonicolor]
MPPATRQPTQQRLRFSQSLKASSNAELTKRLKALHDELRDFDQDLIDPSSLDQAARQLIHPSLLLHKDKAVKAFVGCCLVDILRLYAPEAPYTQAELRDLFDFLVRQFRYVGAPNDPHQAEYFFIVDSLASVKSVVLVCDLDAADELMERIFKEAFDTISSTSPKNVEIALSDILLALLEETPSLPTPVTDILLSQFLPKTVKSRPASFRLAVEVCKGATDKLQRYVCQYFAEVITATLTGRGAGGDSDDDDDDSSEDEGGRRKGKGKGKGIKGKGKATGGAGGVDDDLAASFVEAHDLIRSLNRHVPSLLLNVIPQLEEELTTSHPSYRRLATEVLGSMFGEKIGQGDLARAFPGTWREWGRRAGDVVPKVRCAVAEGLKAVWREHPELGDDIENILKTKLLADSDEKVRIAACGVFDEMDYETAAHHVSRRMLEALAERTVDRKDKVRAVAFKALGRLYDLAYSEIEARDEHAIDHFGWIPGMLVEGLIYSDGSSPGTTPSQLHLVDTSFSRHILPLPRTEKDAEDISSWVDRFLLVERGMQGPPSKQRAALLSLARLGEGRGGSVWEGYLQACEAYNSGIIDDKDQAEQIKGFLKNAIKVIAAKMPDPTKAADDLWTFAKQNVGQLYKELRVLLDPQTELKTFIKNERDIMRRLEKMPSGSSVMSTFASFIRLSCYTLINRSSIPSLLKRLQGASPSSSSSPAEAELFAQSAQRTLEHISKLRPVLYKAHVAELTKMLSGDPNVGDESATVALHALAKLKQVEPGLAIDAKLSKRALHFAKSGTARQAKYAATLIALDTGRPGTLDDLVEHLADALPTATQGDLVPHLSALARIARYGRDSFETKSEQITVSTLEILKRASVPGEAAPDDETTWVEDAFLDPLTQDRLLAIKVLANRCLPYANTDSAKTVAEPVFGMLWPLLQLRGEDDDEEGTYSVPVASRLRLAAASAILKLLTTNDPHYVKSVLQHFDALSRSAQDTCFEVRDGFLRKLLQYLRSNRLHPAAVPLFHMTLFLVAHEPEDELRVQVVQFVKARGRRPDRQMAWELPFLRLVHLLAHHPDFEGQEHEADEIKLMAKYFELYLDCLATSENVSLLYHLALKVKGVRDHASSEYDHNLYALSELAQHLIKAVAKRHGWPISTHPGQVKMPGDIFRALPSPAVAKKISAQVYLKDELLQAVDAAGKSDKKKTVVPRKRKSADEKTTVVNKSNGTKAKKRPRASKSTPRSKKRKSANDWDSSASENASSASESSSFSDEDDDEEEAGVVVPPKIKEKTKPTAKGSARRGLRSDPDKKVEKGLGEESSGQEEDDAAMEVDEASDAEADAKGKGKGKGKGKSKAEASPTSKGTKPSSSTAATSPAATAVAKTAKKRVVGGSTNGKNPASKAKGVKKDGGEALPRRALRGLKQPRALKKGDIEAVSDVGDTDDDQISEED